MGDYPTGREKRVKVTNIFVPVKKSSANSKSTRKSDDSSETYSDIVPFESDLSPVGNIVLKRSPPTSARTCSSRHPTAGKSRPTAPRPSIDAPPSSRT